MGLIEYFNHHISPEFKKTHTSLILCTFFSLRCRSLSNYLGSFFSILGDERLEKMEEHEESVYSCAWAGNDPWIFASVSFDGRVIVSKVKRHHKYAILRL